jgi:TonB family protein
MASSGSIAGEHRIGLRFLQMVRMPSVMCVLAAMAVMLFAAPKSFAQTERSPNAEEQGVVLTNLSPPTYPPLAKQAHITGEVILELSVEQDGRLVSVTVVSGHPLLEQGALDSVHQSRLACRNCTEGMTVRRIVYSFQLGPMKSCAQTPTTPDLDHQDESYPQVIQSIDHVKLIDEPIRDCDVEIFSAKKVRAARCLYLWRCGVRILITHQESDPEGPEKSDHRLTGIGPC